MSYFDDASLVMIPSGYKDQKVYSVKPIDGSGDLTFSRASNATRVNSSGLVEKVRENRVLYSNDFTNAAWIKFYTSVTAGEADPFGGTNATRYVSNGIGGYIYQNSVCVSGAEMTASVWVKSNTGSSQNFVITANSGSSASSSFTATTSWQRISYTFTSSSNGDILFGYNNVALVDLLIYGFQLETGVMTDYIATTSSAVSVGPVSGLPRLDYSGGASCPSLLLEPQRTNTAFPSEDFSGYTGSSTTIVSNQAVSPDGYTNADLIYPTSSGSFAGRYKTLAPSTTGVVSCFVKQAGKRYAIIGTDNNGTYTCIFDLQTATVVYEATNYTGKIEAFANGWYRISAAYTSSTAANYPFIGVADDSNGAVTADGTNGLYIWGFQYEVNAAYATSYINTLSTAVTRVADAASKTGISSLIGTEGVLFLDWVMIRESASASEDYYPIAISDGTSANMVTLNNYNNKLVAYVSSGGSAVFTNNTFSGSSGLRIKAAIAYKANDFAFYVNGVQIATDNAGAAPVGMSVINVGTYITGGNNDPIQVNQLLIFPTRLSNADLATLTA